MRSLDSIKRRLRGLFNRLVTLAVVFAILILGELLPPLQALQAYLDAHPGVSRALSALTITMTALGLLLLVGTQFIVRVGDVAVGDGSVGGIPVGDESIGDGFISSEHVHHAGGGQMTERGPGGRFARWFSGLALSAGFSDQATFWEVKHAYRRGIWWQIPRWRRMTLMALAAILLTYGLFGFIFVVAPAGIKLLVALSVLYATAATAWGFYRAGPPQGL